MFSFKLNFFPDVQVWCWMATAECQHKSFKSFGMSGVYIALTCVGHSFLRYYSTV